mgnify:CR=1 FL=1
MKLTPFEKLDKAAADRLIIISAIATANALVKSTETQHAVDDDVSDQVITKLAEVLEQHFGISA